MVKVTLTFKCPFCKISEIRADYYPSTVRYKKGTYGGGKPGVYKSGDNLIIRMDKCPKCGKSEKEIKKAYEKGKELSHAERLRRLQASGLPTKIVSERE